MRRVSAEGANRWQTIGEFTVEPPLGLEALQVFATSAPPDRALPPTRLDPATRSLRFAGWTLEPARRRLLNPEGVEVALTGGEYDLLVAMVERYA